MPEWIEREGQSCTLENHGLELQTMSGSSAGESARGKCCTLRSHLPSAELHPSRGKPPHPTPIVNHDDRAVLVCARVHERYYPTPPHPTPPHPPQNPKRQWCRNWGENGVATEGKSGAFWCHIWGAYRTGRQLDFGFARVDAERCWTCGPLLQGFHGRVQLQTSWTELEGSPSWDPVDGIGSTCSTCSTLATETARSWLQAVTIRHFFSSGAGHKVRSLSRKIGQRLELGNSNSSHVSVSRCQPVSTCECHLWMLPCGHCRRCHINFQPDGGWLYIYIVLVYF